MMGLIRSKSVEGVGLAVVTEDSCEAAKLPNVASIYTAELSAINRALALVHRTNKKNFVIYADSKSALESLNSSNSSHPLVLKAREWLFEFPVNINLFLSAGFLPMLESKVMKEQIERQKKYAAKGL